MTIGIGVVITQSSTCSITNCGRVWHEVQNTEGIIESTERGRGLDGTSLLVLLLHLHEKGDDLALGLRCLNQSESLHHMVDESVQLRVIGHLEYGRVTVVESQIS